MPDRRKTCRLLVASLLAAAVAAPAATAMPSVEYTSKANAPRKAADDLHASTVQAPAPAKQDLRAEGSIAGSRAAAHAQSPGADLRGEWAAYPTPAPEPPVGLPSWPVDPKPIVPAAPAPVAGDGGGADVEWPVAVLALLGARALGGAAGIAGHRMRSQTRPAH